MDQDSEPPPVYDKKRDRGRTIAYFLRGFLLTMILTAFIGLTPMICDKDPVVKAFHLLGCGIATLIQSIAVVAAVIFLQKYQDVFCRAVASFMENYKRNQDQNAISVGQGGNKPNLPGTGTGGLPAEPPLSQYDISLRDCNTIVSNDFAYFCIAAAFYVLMGLGIMSAGAQKVRQLHQIVVNKEKKAPNFVKPDRTKSMVVTTPTLGTIAGRLPSAQFDRPISTAVESNGPASATVGTPTLKGTPVASRPPSYFG
ncbi:hypothetical protein BCR33DRAFT_720402 [Rhizoclosmatium globosum]|uniref:Uncharacterized protein n=1 Tax=Rhizoclosmatium globosum TaxID=329046 RepID=A0A1Y2BWN4_9FUNG|nr:hypothetical protein BCR33DRAFT_720402 [Rhizoclosmatium globosum]|eukprot:ORY39169.1 hypothetical protein BCR33DRAFT_720402 [Rhizoclosmatium globosum]